LNSLGGESEEGIENPTRIFILKDLDITANESMAAPPG
jgi:hypothetical protein